MKIDEEKIKEWRQKKSLKIRGTSILYQVVTQEIPFCDDGQVIATAVTYSYIKEDTMPEKRPVLFAYNGGPGSSSVWVHLGLLGTMRVKIKEDSEVNPSVSGPYEIEENPYSILDVADVVILDPPGCGFGQIVDEAKAQACFGVCSDAYCAAKIIEKWLMDQGRYSSPKYLLGESYGTVRTCMLLRELMGGPMSSSHQLLAIPVDGVIMMGTAILMEPFKNECLVEPTCMLLRELMGGPMSSSHQLLAIPVDGVIMMGTAILMEPFKNECLVEPSVMLLRELMGGPMSSSHQLLAIPVDGVIMMGTAILMEPFKNECLVEPSVLQLIGMTATRLYHRPLSKKEQDLWKNAGFPIPNEEENWEESLANALWEFAANRYLPALFMGNNLKGTKREEMITLLSLLTGVSVSFLDSHNLAISPDTFRRECLRDKDLEVGAYDSRYTMEKTLEWNDPVADDPAMGQYTPIYVGAMNDAMRTFLGMEKERQIPYRGIDFTINGRWEYETGEKPEQCLIYVGAMNDAMRTFLGMEKERQIPYRGIDFTINGRWEYETGEKPEQCLVAAMRRNKNMRALFMTGLYDLVTPPGNVRYLVSHQNLPKDRVIVREYTSGHMPYMGKEAAKKVSEDLRNFLCGSSGLGKECHEKEIGL